MQLPETSSDCTLDHRNPVTQEGLTHVLGHRHQTQHAGTATVAEQQFPVVGQKGPRAERHFHRFLAILALFAILTKGTILTPQNISNLVVQNSYILILAIGMVIVIIAGHIDLSVGSVVGFTGALAGVFIVQMGLPIWLGVLLVLVIGGVVGAWQGYWVAYFGIPAFIVTLAGMLIFRGGTLLVLGNKQISPFPDGFRNISAGFADGLIGYINVPAFLGGGEADLFTLLLGAAVRRSVDLDPGPNQGGSGRSITRVSVPPALSSRGWSSPAVAIMYFVLQLSKFKGLPYVLFILAILVLVYSAVMNRSVFGRHVYAIGGNLHAAELSGIKVKAVTFWVFVNMGVLAALAGIVFAARLNLANPTNGAVVRTRRHCRRIHRRRRGDRWGRQGHRRHRRRPHRWRAEQRNVDPRSGCRLPAGHQGPGPARRGRLRRLQQAPLRRNLTCLTVGLRIGPSFPLCWRDVPTQPVGLRSGMRGRHSHLIPGVSGPERRSCTRAFVARNPARKGTRSAAEVSTPRRIWHRRLVDDILSSTPAQR